MGSNPIGDAGRWLATTTTARWSIGAGRQPLTLAGWVRLPYGLMSYFVGSVFSTRWWNWQTRGAQNAVPSGVGVRLSPWSLGVRCIGVAALHAALSKQRYGIDTRMHRFVIAEWTGAWFPARSHKPHDVGSNPTSATSEVRGQRSEVRSQKGGRLTSDL